MRKNQTAAIRTKVASRLPPSAAHCKQVIGTYGIALTHADIPNFIVGARRGSPLVLGVGKDENFLASDVSAIVAYTRDAVYLNDFDIVAVERDKFEISSLAGETGNHQVSKVEFSAEDIKKGDYPHYMLKEIFEQPGSVRDAMRGRLSADECTAKLGGLNMTPAQLRDVGRIVLTGCGTALHAAMVGEYLIEQLAHIPMEVEYASEFRHRNTPMTSDTLVFAISQSGETADTLRRAARKPAQRLSHARHLQQCRQHDRARKRRRRLHACRAGDWRGRDEIVYFAGHHPHADRIASWPDATSFHGGRQPHHSKRSKRCRNRSRKF